MTRETIIGVDLGGTKVSAGRVEGRRVIRSVTAEISAEESEARVLDRVVEAITKIFISSVSGIGVGVPSLVDVEEGVVYNVQNIPSWKEVHLKKILEEHFRRPVFVNNDANCFAVGEKHFGKGKKYQNLVGLTIGTGLGAGIIIGGRLYSGSNCGAGEFGSIPYKDSILESYCSGQFFARAHGVKGSELYQMARQGDKRALEIFREFGGHLGEAIMIIMLAVDPEAIILGGSVARSFPFFGEAMRERMKSFPYPHAVERLVIDTSVERQIAILGAAALFLNARA
ncbi:MAG: ROK family protein [Clostridiales bacterium]|nr:ROK family protein [Clostridiales bacterium]